MFQRNISQVEQEYHAAAGKPYQTFLWNGTIFLLCDFYPSIVPLEQSIFLTDSLTGQKKLNSTTG